MLFLLRFTDAKTGRGHFSSLYTDPPITGGGGRGGGGGQVGVGCDQKFLLIGAIINLFNLYFIQ